MVDDFIKEFHDLEGTLLKEKKKSLFLLLESHKSLISEDRILKEINEKLIPQTHLEEIYKLEFLMYFRRSSDLLELLKSGSEIAASKIVRQPWFIISLVKDFKNEEFVKNVFSQLSIVVRTKILKQILKHIKDEEFVNALFECLLKIYGLKPSIILLPGCSIDKIKEILLNRNLKLSKSQIKQLHEKNPSLITFYFEEFHRKDGNMYQLSDFSKYLSVKDPELYVKLSLKYEVYSFQLGRQTTKKYVSENKEAIMKDPKKYLDLNIFEKHALVSQLGKDFPLFLKAALPKQLSELMGSRAFGLLEYYPKKKRYDLYHKVFEEVYKRSLFLNKEFITDELLELIGNDEEREKWVEKFENKVEYLKFKRSSVAAVELKEQLLKCDGVAFREQLLQYIVMSCSIGEDYEALLDILKFTCNRFRNTEGSVLHGFLEEIHKKMKLNKLSAEHWKYIHEIILIQNIRNNFINGLLVFEYCKFLYKNGKEFEEMIPIYIKDYNSLRRIDFRNEKFHREFLKLILKHYSGKKESMEKNLSTATDIVLDVRDWNRRHPEDVILVCDKKEIIEAIKKGVDVTWLYYASDEILCMKYLVCRENISEFTDIYFDHMDCLENVTMTKWYLKYKPNIFEEKIDKVIDCLHIKTRYNLMNLLKKYEHTGLVQIITKYYMEKLKDTNEDNKDKIVQLLASIMGENDYLKLLEEYVPKIDTLDITEASIEEKNLHKIQTALAKSVRFTSCQVKALPILLKYCRGDYFQPSLISLYCCFNRIPEESLKMLLDLLLQKPVSVRKHTLFLAALVFPILTNEKLSQKIINNDKNASIQKHLFTSSYKYFLQNPLEHFWNFLRTYMDRLTLHEKESLMILTNISVVPEKYKSVFMKQVCKVFNELEVKEKTPMNSYYDKLMESIRDDDMRFLPSDLCIDIISKKLFKEGYRKNDVCVNFTARFLMYGTNMRDNMQNVLNILKVYKRNYWKTSDGEIAISVIYSILKHIFHKTMDKKHLRVPLSKEFPVILSEEWNRVISIRETIAEYLMLDFMILKYRDNNDLNFYATEINKIFKRFRESYGDLITWLFKDFLSLSLKPLLGDDDYDVKLVKLLAEMLEIDPSLPNYLLVTQLLPHNYNFDDDFMNNFNKVLGKLLKGEEIVQLYLNTHFNH